MIIAIFEIFAQNPDALFVAREIDLEKVGESFFGDVKVGDVVGISGLAADLTNRRFQHNYCCG